MRTALALVLLALPGLAGAETGVIAGRIVYGHGPLAAPRMEVKRDAAVCGKRPVLDESLLVDSKGGLANVVVALAGVKAARPPAKVVLDQKDCVYAPRVQVAQVGATLVLRNSDPLLHNVHAFRDGRTLFNVAMPVFGMRIPKQLDQLGVIKVGCDAGHTWMRAWVVVKPHATAAVTARDGSFRIAGVPAGAHQLELWHERLGTRTLAVAVKPGATATVDLSW
jgi:hypothetical protein